MARNTTFWFWSPETYMVAVVVRLKMEHRCHIARLCSSRLPVLYDDMITNTRSSNVATHSYPVDGIRRWYISVTQLTWPFQFGRVVCAAHLTNASLVPFSCCDNVVATSFRNVCYLGYYCKHC